MLVDLEALLLDTESELDFLKISKFCKNLRFGQYFPYQILKLIGKLSGSSENDQNYDYTFLFTVTVYITIQEILDNFVLGLVYITIL